VAGRWIQAGVIVLVVLTAALTLLAVFLIWRDGYLRGWRAARSSPPTCPRCGYNLSGLTHCRCPECGAEFALDQLWIACRFPKPGGTRRSARPAPNDPNTASADPVRVSRSP